MTFHEWYDEINGKRGQFPKSIEVWNAAMEEAAAMCSRMATMQGLSEAMRGSRYACADAIRALKEEAP